MSRVASVQKRTVSSSSRGHQKGSKTSRSQRRQARQDQVKPSIQPKLRVGKSDDRFEREADRLSGQVMTAPATGSAGPKKEPWERGQKAPRPQKEERERLRSKGGSEGPVSPEFHASLSATKGAGRPLPESARSFMEPRLGYDFSSVRVHTGQKAAGMNREINSLAFTHGRDIYFNKGQFDPGSSQGRRLLAHELTHTIQQGAAISRKEAVTVSEQAPVSVQRLGISDALDYFADKANMIPGFRMFTVILGVNPINMSSVERSAANILRAVIEFIPGGGLITQALDNYGIFDKVGAWVEQQIASLGMTGIVIKKAVSDFLDSLGWSDIFDLGGVWSRAKRIFTEPIDRILSFVKGLVTGIIKFIKDAILIPLAKLAEGTRGYDLLKAVLGEDPITGEPVPRTAETLIGGFMKLIGQEDVWENIKKANAIPRAWAWFKGALASLTGFVQQIPSLFVKAFQSLELADIILVPRAFMKLAAVFGGFIVQFLTWAGNAVWNLLEIIFAVVAPGVMPYIRKAAGAFRTILKNPIGFVGNLVKAGIQGFRQFAANIGKHLKTSLIQWLTGTLGGAGVYIPQAFSIKEIIQFVLSVLGLTWQNIRQKLVKVVGETAVKAMETGFDIVVTLVREGPAAAWEKIKEQLTNLKEIVIEEVMSFVTSKIVQSAVTKIVSMLNPAGAIIQAIIAIYNTIMFFIERMKQIIQVATAFIDSIAAIAAGVITAAANRVEQTLAGLLTLAISFLARFAGLGKVSDAVIKIINKIRAPIDKALDKVVDWIVKTAKSLFAKGKAAAGKAVGAVLQWWNVKKGFTTKSGEKHTLQTKGEGESAKLMVATNPQTIEEHLDQVEGSTDPSNAGQLGMIKKARRLHNDKYRLIISRKGPEQKKKDDLITLFNEIGDILAQLAGGDFQLPPDPERLPSGPKPTDVKVNLLTKQNKDKPNPGTEPPKGRDTGTTGWAEIYDKGLTKVSDKWVQMHLINQDLGGQGAPENLVPGPNSVNTGSQMKGFESSAKTLVNKDNNVVWLETKVAYHGPPHDAFASRLDMSAGLHALSGKTHWVKSSAVLKSGITVPKPDLSGKLSLNSSSGTDFRNSGLSPFASEAYSEVLIGIVKKNRPYASYSAFYGKLEKATEKSVKIGDPEIKDIKTKIGGLAGQNKLKL